MGGFAGVGAGLGKKLKKLDPLRGGDVILEKAGLPTFTGQGDKNIMGSTEAPEAPVAEKAAVMPTADDEKVNQARKRRLALQQQQQGRSSTILTDTTDRLGG
ncbi:hypothetical protein [Pseudomonas chlororaphis]|uniref:hypothetical protein n=1 Tax=Pseudomonas chlororaphis TaxID=587753 RepID=UPI001B323D74|nr:hypothetical protein [Pseudomonas chlororaphis]MBP5059134.1 hypothetical protein [Pseudomonas chlororaphis]MBP5143494.1 hypothetical protein [Pseudomonas chlororaphis]